MGILANSTSFPPWYPGTMALLINPGYLFYVIILLSIIGLGAYRFRNLDKAYRYLVVLCLMILISEIGAKAAVLLNKSNFPFYHTLIPAQSLVYGFIFYYLFKSRGKGGIVALLIGFLFAVGSSIISFNVYEGKFSFPSLNLSILSILMIMGSLYLFYQILKKPSELSLFRIGDFWFASGNLLFWAGTFLIFGLYQWLLDAVHGHPSWMHHLIRILNYILYLTYLLSVYLNAENKPPKNDD